MDIVEESLLKRRAKHRSRTLHKHHCCGTKHRSLSSRLLLRLCEASSQLLSWLVDMRKLLTGSPYGILEEQGKQMVAEKASQSFPASLPGVRLCLVGRERIVKYLLNR